MSTLWSTLIPQGQIYVVSSFHKNSVHRRLTESPQVDIKKVITWIRQILEALCFLAERGIVHRNLCLKNVLLDEHDSVRLFNYGLYCMTDCGRDASFPIGYPPYLPPEVLIGDQESLYRSSAKADVWSLGILALEMLSMNVVTAPEQLGLTSGQLKDWVDYISQWKLDSEIATEALPRQASVTVSEHPELLHFIQSCLVVSVEDRPDFRQLLGHPVFIGLPQVPPTPSLTGWHLHPHLPLLQEDSDASGNSNAVLSDTERLLSSFSLYQIFHLWILAGGILDIPVVKRNGISTSAINRLPQVIRIKDDVEDILSLTDVAPLFSDSICIFPLEPLAEKLATTTQPSLPKGLAAMDDLGLYYKSIEGRNVQRWAQSLLEAPDYWTKRSSQLTEKQRDPSHQARLIVMFNRHLAEYPHSQRRIIEEATIGIPALVRNRVWAAILGISGNPQIEYDMIDKDSEGLMDRQLELDIPRCHQYNEVLASPFGHQKLKRILKAWVASEEHRMVYWQGLDSVCAPFLCLNLHDEALAYSCLKEFVSRFLSDFFVVDNTITINKYMTVFSKLIAFHDPELALHMLTLGLQPSLYAIPWFMTMYAHIFPLDKIYPLWDNLLVGGDYVGLHFGLAILTQLRDQIIHHDFNQCMVLLSELPNIEIEAAISDANFTFKTTPPSFYDNLRSQPRKSEIGKHKGDSHAELPWISVKDFSQIKSISLILDTRDSGPSI
ncbi:rab-GTPase-TBC domain-containing protein [Polychytrium aggregatum]|uniref:rab-GTPase-TBC domain-containing protein n=1 Tax=Polychytrium aggregatum TaxID=110093 RepID=UPI0022FF320B|nr:rab-GTPase-TBC domain-containing protein [Polychytrium aggregatum]KAI9209015.1 rab-GTPase-TBC domain-containing protein [Polychytrium aggregatum]